MYRLLIAASIPILTAVYYAGYFTIAFLFRTHHAHYFLGFGSKPLFQFKVKGVRFSVGAFIPFYGLARFYKIEGKFKKHVGYAWQFSERPVYIRLIVSYGGVLGMLLAAWIFFICIFYFTPEQYIQKEEVNRYGIYPSEVARNIGFERGDKILKINGRDFKRFDELFDPQLFQAEGNTFTLLRNQKEVTVTTRSTKIPPGSRLIEILIPFQVEAVQPGSPAEKLNLQKGDRITRVNGKSVIKVYDLQEEFDKDDDGRVLLEIRRVHAGDTTMLLMETDLNQENRLGIFIHEPLQYTVRSKTIAEAFLSGTRGIFLTFTDHVSGMFGVMAPRKVAGGPVSIAQAFGEYPAWFVLLGGTANALIVFVLWNFLPFPKSVLWETIALVYESIFRKQISRKWFIGLSSVGWFILVTFFLLSVLNDLAEVMAR